MAPRVLVVRSGTRSVLEGRVPAGIEVVERVSHSIEPVRAEDPSPEAKPDLAVFTSRIAVEESLGAGAPALLRRRLAGARVAAVGPETAAALRRAGLPPTLVAAGSAAALLDALPLEMPGAFVLWPCGEDASDALSRGLEGRGARVERRIVYRKVPAPVDPSLAREVAERPFAAFAATSPSALTWLWESLGEAERARLRGTPAVALGPATREALRERGISRVETTAAARFSELLQMLAALAGGAPPK
jgi:uroporphyrinogen-III synthase